jgi:hypothetical protein
MSWMLMVEKIQTKQKNVFATKDSLGKTASDAWQAICSQLLPRSNRMNVQMANGRVAWCCIWSGQMWTSSSFLAKPSLHSQKASLHGGQRRFSAIFISCPQHLRHPRRRERER